MITDSEIKKKGIEALIKELGEVETERFITLLMREPFDYTKWQKELWKDKTVSELSKEAMEHIKKTEKKKANTYKVSVCQEKKTAPGEILINLHFLNVVLRFFLCSVLISQTASEYIFCTRHL